MLASVVNNLIPQMLGTAKLFYRNPFSFFLTLLVGISPLNQAVSMSKPTGDEHFTCAAQPYYLPPNQWVQISLPCAPMNGSDSAKDIFGDDIVGNYGSDWVVFRYDSDDHSYRDVGETGLLNQGEFYWVINMQAEARIDMPASSLASPPKLDVPLPTHSGSPTWFSYGFPFAQNLSWDSHRITTHNGDCATGDGCSPAQAGAKKIVNDHAYRWNGKAYDKVGGNEKLEAWAGYWVATLPAGHGLNPILHVQESVKPIEVAKSNKAYIPNLDFSKDDVYNNQQIKYVTNTQELTDYIEKGETGGTDHAAHAIPHTSIILKENGNYSDVNIRFPKGLHHITIKAEHKHKATIIPLGWDGRSAFIFSRADDSNESIHDINFIDLEVLGKQGGQFIKSEGGATYSVYRVYLSGLKIHDLRTGVYSGLHSHDWTMNDSKVYDLWDNEHAWYMMGWHHSVINSQFYNGSHDILAVRGYYPDGEKHTYISDGDTSCHGNKYIEDRVGRKGFIDRSDWTHYIANNRFLSWSLKTSHDYDSNTHIAIAYGLYGDPDCGAEKVYLPPQNINIMGNLFSNKNEPEQASIRAIQIDAWKGIYNDSLASINGIRIYDNQFIRNKDAEELIAGVANGDYPKPEISKIKAGNNSIIGP
jgi:hypothetical protein